MKKRASLIGQYSLCIFAVALAVVAAAADFGDARLQALQPAYTCPPTDPHCCGPFCGPPTPPSCAPVTIEAEDPDVTHSVGTADGTVGWNLYCNGYVEKSAAFTTGPAIVRVRARGTAAGGISPRLTVTVLGSVIGTTQITGSTYRNYDFPLNGSWSNLPIRVTFDNGDDCAVGGRDLMIDSISMVCPSGGDPGVYGFEPAGTSGWTEDPAAQVVTSVERSTDAAFAGAASLEATLSEPGMEKVRVMTPTLPGGSTAAIRVWIPSGTPVSSLQPYAQEADSPWTFYGNWKSIADFTPDAWNLLTLFIPRTAQPLRELGLEITTSSVSPAANTVYIDSVTWRSDDESQYGFENGFDGWTDQDPARFVVYDLQWGRGGPRVYQGLSSLHISLAEAGTEAVFVRNPPVPAGATIKFHVFVPGGLGGAGVVWIQPFAQEGEAGGWAWHGNYKEMASVGFDAWKEITVTLPADSTPIAFLGIQFHYDGPYAASAYIDSVSW